MDKCLIDECLTNAIDEFQEMNTVKISFSWYCELKEKLLEEIDGSKLIKPEALPVSKDLNSFQRKEIAHPDFKKALIKYIEWWCEKLGVSLSHKQQTDLYEELMDQLLYREILDLRNKELRNAS